MSERQRPEIAAAFLCERILTEKDDVQTFVRVVDTLIGRYPAGSIPAGSKPPVKFQVWLAVSLKSGEAKGKYTLRFRMHDPSGTTKDMGEVIPVALGGGEHGANVNILLTLTLVEGLFLIDVILDNEVVTRVPFRVRLEPQVDATPENSKPSVPPADPPKQ